MENSMDTPLKKKKETKLRIELAYNPVMPLWAYI